MRRLTRFCLYLGLTLFFLHQGTAAFALLPLAYLIIPLSGWIGRRCVAAHHLTQRFVAENNDPRRRWA